MFFLRSKLRPRPRQRPTSSKTSRRFATVSQEQKRTFLAEKSKHNSRRILVFFLFCTYALLAVLGTSDYDILLKQPIQIPGLRITLPLLTFYRVTPLAILALHFGVLWMHERYRQELQNIPREMIEEIPFSILDAPHLDASSLARWSVNFLVYLFPLLVLTVFFFRFADYQSIALSFWHLLCLNIDLLFILHFAHPAKDRIFKLFGALFSLVLFLIFTFFCSFFIYPSHLLAIKQIEVLRPLLPHLNVTHCNLNKDFDLDEAKAYRELDDGKEKRPYLFYTTMVDLRNRNFIQADLSYSKMVNFDFRGADLRGASLKENQLQYSSFDSANLQRADLRDANLQEARLEKADLQEAYLEKADLQEAHLGGANLQKADLKYAKLQKADLNSADLEGAVLEEANLQGAFLKGAWLQGADLSGAKLQGADLREIFLPVAPLTRANLQGADLRDAYLLGADLRDANLQEARLEKADLQEAYLEKADLQEAHLGGANLQKADLKYAKLQKADLNSADLEGAVLEEANLQGAFLKGAKLQKADLKYAKLQKADLSGAELQRADLSCAELQGADLELCSFLVFGLSFVPCYAILPEAVLSDADLEGAVLEEANLQGAFLKRARLQGADLSGADLEGAVLEEANLQGAFLKGARLQGADLSGAKLQGACARENCKNFLELIGKSTQFSRLGDEKFRLVIQMRVKRIKYTLINKPWSRKWISLVKQAAGKTSLEWLKMQKGKYVTGVLTWEEACKIQEEVVSPGARIRMGLDQIDWQEKCK